MANPRLDIGVNTFRIADIEEPYGEASETVAVTRGVNLTSSLVTAFAAGIGVNTLCAANLLLYGETSTESSEFNFPLSSIHKWLLQMHAVV